MQRKQRRQKKHDGAHNGDVDSHRIGNQDMDDKIHVERRWNKDGKSQSDGNGHEECKVKPIAVKTTPILKPAMVA